ncbi:beta-alanine-activating enzyme isoform X4 [Leptidea sinapis]|uniref:beta-alanine-activating enzyme isoform X4 n=1 Tax=Leptidea sinapis TaxID=189913 RepID=UPI0021C330F2|nr:beta-alanine-activating enzyme isoform X4 [Leptidea sinapis]
MKFKHGYYKMFVNTCAKYPSRVAMRHHCRGQFINYTYSELYGICEYLSQNMQQLNCNKNIIGLITDRNIIIPCLIASAHKCSSIFMFLDPEQDFHSIINEMQFDFLISVRNVNSRSTEILNREPDKSLTIFDLVVDMYCVQSKNIHNRICSEQPSFIASTSGSTGNPKLIQVPIQCLQPNIDDLTKIFQITPSDVIYFSTPLTFDPSMVEILLAITNGASLLIAPEKSCLLFPEDLENSITVWQTTPSKFFQLSNTEIMNRILSANSTLRILALGGEPLIGVKRLKELKHEDNRTKIYALYGVTEMSCWATVAELDLNKIANDAEVPLGDCLSETNISIKTLEKEKNKGNIVLSKF